MSQLKVNSIVPVGGLPSGATAGGVIQTVTASTTTQVSQSYSSEGTITTTITDTGLSASITPSSNSSKILEWFVNSTLSVMTVIVICKFTITLLSEIVQIIFYMEQSVTEVKVLKDIKV